MYNCLEGIWEWTFFCKFCSYSVCHAQVMRCLSSSKTSYPRLCCWCAAQRGQKLMMVYVDIHTSRKLICTFLEVLNFAVFFVSSPTGHTSHRAKKPPWSNEYQDDRFKKGSESWPELLKAAGGWVSRAEGAALWRSRWSHRSQDSFRKMQELVEEADSKQTMRANLPGP